MNSYNRKANKIKVRNIKVRRRQLISDLAQVKFRWSKAKKTKQKTEHSNHKIQKEIEIKKCRKNKKRLVKT